MKAARKVIHLFVIVLSLGALLAMAACGAQTAAPPASAGQTADSPEAKASDTRKNTDYKGNEVQIPVQPQRVIFAGETFGDLLVLGVDAVGAQLSSIKDHVFENRVKSIEDVGFPINLEKVLELKPDLILVASTDTKQYEQLSKVAPTVMFDTFAPLDERIAVLGELLGKQQQAKQWL
ncbi:ABC transporter substrate-binding protein [Paenibacillus elgii]